MVRISGKKFSKYYSLDTTKEFIDEFSKEQIIFLYLQQIAGTSCAMD